MVLLGALARFASFRWLCVVLCALSVLVAASNASAASAAQTKTRVWDFELPSLARLELETPALVENASGNSLDACDARVRTNLWQARWFSNVAGGIYDVRARQWSPELGAFLQVDEFQFLRPTGTLWSWPGQNPYRWRDPSGRDLEEWILRNGNDLAAAVAVVSLAPVFAAAAITAAPAALAGAAGGTSLLAGGKIGIDAAFANDPWMLADGIVMTLMGGACVGPGLGAGPRAGGTSFNREQQALIELAKESQRTGISQQEAKTLLDWAREVGLPARGPESHPGRPFGKKPHIHVGPVNHIPVN